MTPLRDMKRYNKLLAGASWMAEYGNPDTDDWEFLQKYSPYHSKFDTKQSCVSSSLEERLYFHQSKEIGGANDNACFYYFIFE